MSEDDFKIFQEVLSEIEQEKTKQTKQTCKHIDTINDNNVNICRDCGEEIIRDDISQNFDKFIKTNNKNSGIRHNVRKVEEKTIYKDIENMGFHEKIVQIANDMYFSITNGQIYRNDARKSIIFACVFSAYKIIGTPQTCDTLREVFKIDRKVAIKGLKFISKFQTNIPSITPSQFVGEIMDKFDATQEQKDEVICLYDKIKNRSSILNRSRPTSISSSLVYYYICMKKKRITLKEFSKKVNLSELTIIKIVKEIEKILNKNK